MLDSLLQLTIDKHASDLHLSPGQVPIMRIDGDLIFLQNHAVLTSAVIEMLLNKILNETAKQQFQAELSHDFAYQLEDKARFRVNAFYQAEGVALVFRAIPTHIPTLDELSLPNTIKSLLDLPHGLILVTGPTGSGKSTTLAAMVNYLNTNHALHLISIEDPIEFKHQSRNSLISQRQIKRDAHCYSSALQAALREDPDVILVGEMRDLETIRLALTAAETGHLILATLHTSSAPRTINRLIDVFPAEEKNMIRNMLSESLQAVICQTLIKKIHGGRVAAFEIMLANNAIRHLIREDKIAQMINVIQTNGQAGMCTLSQSLSQLAGKGLIYSE